MRSGIRLLLAAWMSLALPLQGLAAATMLHCGQRPAEVPAAPLASGSVHTMAPDAPCHGVAAKTVAMQDGPCDSCASCAAFSAVALIPYMPPVGVEAPAVRIAFAGSPHEVRVPDGPDRPPRTSQA